MRKINKLIVIIAIVSLVVAVISAGCSPADKSRLRIVTSTSWIAFLVAQIGNDKVDVINIIPPAQCPGHFDIKPGDMQKLADADLFIMHGWQGEKFSDDLIASADNPELVSVKIELMSNWMIPVIQQEATDKIAAVLCQIDTENCEAYRETAADYKDSVEVKGAELKNRLAQANVSDLKVLCAEMQVGFVKWIGMNIVNTFGGSDSLTPQMIKELVDEGSGAKVDLIIENLQSCEDTGAGIAEELNCRKILLSDFPGGFDNTETWEKAIEKNIEIILDAVIE